jgi:AcrR family transcriptional regulator
VARTAAPNRVGDIVEAALRVFGRSGFSRAQMADVAEEAGVSVGTLYNYVEGKEALLLLCAGYDLGVEGLDGSLPLTVASRKAFLGNLRQRLNGFAHLPSLESALARKSAPADVVAECAQIVGDFFDFTARTRRGMDALERSARDVPDVAALFYDDTRIELFQNLMTYIARRAKQGRIPQPIDPLLTARFAAESLTWMARHRHGDPDGSKLDDSLVRDSTIQLITRAITGGSA